MAAATKKERAVINKRLQQLNKYGNATTRYHEAIHIACLAVNHALELAHPALPYKEFVSHRETLEVAAKDLLSLRSEAHQQLQILDEERALLSA